MSYCGNVKGGGGKTAIFEWLWKKIWKLVEKDVGEKSVEGAFEQI